MAGQQLDSALFEQALGAYEGMMQARSGETNQSAAHRDCVALVDRMFPGFRTTYEAREEERKKSVEQIIIDRRILTDDGAFTPWYGGSKVMLGEWPDYRRRLESGGLPASAIESIDQSTEMILSRCANPKQPGDRRKGLVIGYVQSGKTANFTGLIAKAVDEGYRIIIVLAGMYTNLRVQTQLRLQKDLGIDTVRERAGIGWTLLTNATADVGKSIPPGFLSNTANVAVLVVKKHEMRLANVARFLRSIPEDIRNRRGVLIIDDESDQATPNTLAAKDLVSTINQRIRDIWAAVPTGSYVAYTATPFANVFIDPADAGDLYPDDFITVLPKPDSYMGSELFFDVRQDADADEDEVIHQLAHEVPEHEAELFTPRPKDIDSFDPQVTPSLEAAVRWFVLATAIRELRTGSVKHSSMLVHTSQLIRAHQRTKEVVADLIGALNFNLENEEDEFRSLYEAEIDRAASLRDGERVPSWTETWERVHSVLPRVVVKIDNGQSDDRLVYTDEQPQTVIAIGGGTLSRGLTLEGLVVSYFLRSSNAYDTLLQMGRWFGFRPRYRDLVRVWMGPGLLEDYAHLARVEKQLRDEVAVMEGENRTPRDFAVKVQSHPGRLEITSSNKMTAAQLVRAGLGGTRRQTIYLDRSPGGIADGQRAARRLVERALAHGGPVLQRSERSAKPFPSLLIPGLPNEDLVAFLRDYWVAPSDKWLQPDGMADWLQRHGTDASWNLVLLSGPGGGRSGFELADGIRIGTSSRAPLKPEYWSSSRLGQGVPQGADIVNIRALMSSADQMLDLRILADQDLLSQEDVAIVDGVDVDDVPSVKTARSLVRPEEGMILLYAVDRDSRPRGETSTRTREPMNASGELIGLGVVFPHVEAEDYGEYWAVQLANQVVDDATATQAPDNEGDYVLEDAR
ncbi:hypothetical protein BF93_11960 [Brachybacterium phenoliresistens]|uniref:Putative endonuclease Z1 domain-containing protein n=1 Tax=Brachybacterium phenoliresistens TaxID=396014 RepID=Z9JXF0_9MICO|nr:Z1 domain-containing protein [Brachybacterium phenoliresistens]EWS82467.1 hypothetical protein BF93_11960 [Brachybacterium phenoliresistens]